MSICLPFYRIITKTQKHLLKSPKTKNRKNLPFNEKKTNLSTDKERNCISVPDRKKIKTGIHNERESHWNIFFWYLNHWLMKGSGMFLVEYIYLVNTLKAVGLDALLKKCSFTVFPHSRVERGEPGVKTGNGVLIYRLIS